MQAQTQNKIPEIDVIIEATLSDYTPPTADLRVAARNFLRYGMSGYLIRVGEIQEGFCDHESLGQNPGEVPRADLVGIMKRLHAVLLERGHQLYAKTISPYTNGEFCAFSPGEFVHD